MALSDPAHISNLMATIESVAVGDPLNINDPEDMSDMLGSTVLQLADGQSINVVEMSHAFDDTINVVQVETTELGDMSVDDMCAIDIDADEQNHILNETGAHVVVNTESEILPSTSPSKGDGEQTNKNKSSLVLPTVPFSFPGQTFDTKCQKLILNVWDFFRRVKKNPDLLDEIKTPQERAAAALHISAATIGKIGKNFRRTGKLETPGKRRQRAKPVVDSVTEEQEHVIRTLIQEYKDNRIAPTLPLLLSECRDRINFQGGATSFRRILQRMGYKGLSFAKPGTNSTIAYRKTTPSSSSPSKSLHHTSEDLIKKEKETSYISIPVKSSGSKKSSSKPAHASSHGSNPSIPIPLNAIKQETIEVTEVSASKSSKMINNLFGGSFVQLGLDSKDETFTISPQVLSSLALGKEPQTLHLLKSDNTIQPIQIVYANIVD